MALVYNRGSESFFQYISSGFSETSSQARFRALVLSRFTAASNPKKYFRDSFKVWNIRKDRHMSI
jgi:hypothetical protein